MACGNNEVSRSSVGNITPQGAIDPFLIKYQPDAVSHKTNDDGSKHYYVDDRGNPRKGTIYPHIHHGQDLVQNYYFVQSSRAPRHFPIAYGSTKQKTFTAHPDEEGIKFSGSNPPDPKLLDMAVDLIGSLLREEPLL
jgi:hypothetical protein